MALAVTALALFAATPRPERVPLLSGNVVPTSYDLTIAPNLAGVNYGTGGHADGEETIVVRILRPTNEITMNAALVRVREATIDGVAAPVVYFTVAQQIAIRSNRPISPGVHRLFLRFQGSILSDVHGLWPDSMDGNAPNLVTNFEPATARSLFPCFDEPQYRAAFTVHVVAPADWTVVGNMPVASRQVLPDGRAKTGFQPTPPMPTYLLTLDMGKFIRVSSQVGITPIAVYVRPGQEELAKSVLATASESMAFFERDLGTPYPLPKLDIVIAPGVLNDAEQGYGAITVFTENQVSGHGNADPLRAKEEAFGIVAGSIAEQWLGDLASPSWWSEAWVTYGLAGSEVMRAEHALRPALTALPNEIDWGWMGAYDKHSGTSVRRTITDDRDPAAWQGLNDRTYVVGPAMLDMWRAYVGNASMQRALNAYLHQNENSAVGAATFWKEFSSPAATAYQRAWLDQFGTPFLRAKLSCSRNKQALTLAQWPIRATYSSAAPNALWPIPINLHIGNRDQRLLMSSRAKTLAAGSCGTTVALNEGMRPPYITFAPGIQSGTSATDRLRVFQDTQFLYDAHLVTVNDLIVAAAQYAPSNAGIYRMRYALWDFIKDARLLRGSPAEARFDQLIRAWAVPLEVKSRGAKSQSIDASARGSLLELLSWMPDPSLEEMAQTTFLEEIAHPGYYPNSWGNAELAAQGATAERLSKLLPVPNPSAFATVSPSESYLLAVTNGSDITTVLASASRLSNFCIYVTALGARNPQIVSTYLEGHARDLLRTVPPTQQAYSLTSAVVDGAWSARSPKAWRVFFERYLTQRDRPIVDNAMKQIATKWARRRELEKQLLAGK